jgi:TonB family protein
LWVKQFGHSLKLFQCVVLLLTAGAATVPAQGVISASDLLERASQAQPATGDNGLRRLFRLQERAPDGTVQAQRRVEVWTLPPHKLSTIRVYDETGAMLAGAWHLSGGQQKSYRLNATPQIRTVADTPDNTPLSLNNIWQLPPSADIFKTLLNYASQTVVQENANAYTIYFRVGASGPARSLVKATLFLRRSDLQPIQQIFLVAQEEAIVEYTFSEIPWDEKLAAAPPPAVGALDSELLAAARPQPGPTPNPLPEPTPVATPSPAAPPETPAPVANGPLEVGSLAAFAVKRKEATYPPAALASKIQGRVKVYIEVNEQGAVSKIRGSEGPNPLKTAAEEAARGWKFPPRLVQGQPVRVTGYLVFNFALP